MQHLGAQLGCKTQVHKLDAKPGCKTWIRIRDKKPGYKIWTQSMGDTLVKLGSEAWVRNPDAKPGCNTRKQQLDTQPRYNTLMQHKDKKLGYGPQMQAGECARSYWGPVAEVILAPSFRKSCLATQTI